MEPARAVVDAANAAFAFLVEDEGFRCVRSTWRAPSEADPSTSAEVRFATRSAFVGITWFNGELESSVGVRRLLRSRGYGLAEIADALDARDELGPFPRYVHVEDEIRRGVEHFARFVRTYAARVWSESVLASELAARQDAYSDALTKWASGKGPPPRRGKLP